MGEALRQDAGSRTLIGVAVTVALLMYIMLVPDPLLTPFLLLICAGILRIYVSMRKIPVDTEISPHEKHDIVFYALIGLLTLLVIGGIIVKDLFKPPIPSAIATLSFIPFAAVLFSQLMAVSEEVYFRGELFSLFSIQFGVSPSILISTVFFVVYHLKRYGSALDNLAYVFVGGIMLAWVASKTMRVLTPMISHCLNNLLGTAFLVPVIVILVLWVFLKYRRGRLTWEM